MTTTDIDILVDLDITDPPPMATCAACGGNIPRRYRSPNDTAGRLRFCHLCTALDNELDPTIDASWHHRDGGHQ